MSSVPEIAAGAKDVAPVHRLNVPVQEGDVGLAQVCVPGFLGAEGEAAEPADVNRVFVKRFLEFGNNRGGQKVPVADDGGAGVDHLERLRRPEVMAAARGSERVSEVDDQVGVPRIGILGTVRRGFAWFARGWVGRAKKRIDGPAADVVVQNLVGGSCDPARVAKGAILVDPVRHPQDRLFVSGMMMALRERRVMILRIQNQCVMKAAQMRLTYGRTALLKRLFQCRRQQCCQYADNRDDDQEFDERERSGETPGWWRLRSG